jgi:hypothetical protein
MLTLSETIIFFTPIIIFILIFMVVIWKIILTADGEARFLTITTFLFWIFLTLLYCIFTLSYLIGPDCVFCYEPRHLRIAGKYLIAVLVYGVIGLGLILLARHGKK